MAGEEDPRLVCERDACGGRVRRFGRMMIFLEPKSPAGRVAITSLTADAKLLGGWSAGNVSRFLVLRESALVRHPDP
jgi:hypothetical protein